MCGVTNMTSSFFLFEVERAGEQGSQQRTSPRMGTFFLFLAFSVWMRPPMITVVPSCTRTSVEACLVFRSGALADELLPALLVELVPPPEKMMPLSVVSTGEISSETYGRQKFAA